MAPKAVPKAHSTLFGVGLRRFTRPRAEGGQELVTTRLADRANPFYCQRCTKGFASKQALVSHNRCVHPDSEPPLDAPAQPGRLIQDVLLAAPESDPAPTTPSGPAAPATPESPPVLEPQGKRRRDGQPKPTVQARHHQAIRTTGHHSDYQGIRVRPCDRGTQGGSCSGRVT